MKRVIFTESQLQGLPMSSPFTNSEGKVRVGRKLIATLPSVFIAEVESKPTAIIFLGPETSVLTEHNINSILLNSEKETKGCEFVVVIGPNDSPEEIPNAIDNFCKENQHSFSNSMYMRVETEEFIVNVPQVDKKPALLTIFNSGIHSRALLAATA
jgi:hypothetical protein